MNLLSFYALNFIKHSAVLWINKWIFTPWLHLKTSDKTTECRLMQSCGGSFMINLCQRQAPAPGPSIWQNRNPKSNLQSVETCWAGINHQNHCCGSSDTNVPCSSEQNEKSQIYTSQYSPRLQCNCNLFHWMSSIGFSLVWYLVQTQAVTENCQWNSPAKLLKCCSAFLLKFHRVPGAKM